MSSRLPRFRTFALGVLAVAIPAALAVAPAASASTPFGGPHNEFRQTNLVSDMSGAAQLIDPNLQNAWGLALGPTTPLWVADNGTSVSTLYSIAPGGGMVQQVPLTVTLPPMDSAPTGQVFNPTGDFVVTSKAGMGPALFIFSSESGHIIAWNPKADPVMGGASTAQVEYSSPIGAVFKGLTMASTRFGTFLYATDFHNGRVDVFNSRFHLVRLPGSFRDRHLPRGYAPFGIREINGLIYVTYAKQDADRHDDVAGAGHGFVNVFDLTGRFEQRFATRGVLNSPWAMTLAPAGFGDFSGDVLIGNFGDGRIHAFNSHGHLVGTLRDTSGRPLVIDGLWALKPGNGVSGATSDLWFSAGPGGETHGLLGILHSTDDD